MKSKFIFGLLIFGLFFFSFSSVDATLNYSNLTKIEDVTTLDGNYYSAISGGVAYWNYHHLFVCEGTSCWFEYFHYDTEITNTGEFSVPEKENFTLLLEYQHLWIYPGATYDYGIRLYNPLTLNYDAVFNKTYSSTETGDYIRIASYVLPGENYSEIYWEFFKHEEINSTTRKVNYFCESGVTSDMLPSIPENDYNDSLNYIQECHYEGDVTSLKNVFGIDRTVKIERMDEIEVDSKYIFNNVTKIRTFYTLHSDTSRVRNSGTSDWNFSREPTVQGFIYFDNYNPTPIETPLTYYRFENNTCVVVSLYLNETTENDYLDLADCTALIVSGGGGGGVEEEIVLPEIPESGDIDDIIDTAVDWTLKTLNGEDSYLFGAYSGQEKSKTLRFENFEGNEQTIKLNCLDGEGELCQYITFEENPVKLSIARNIFTYNDFVLTLPLDAEEGQYSFAIVGTDDTGKYSVITNSVRVNNGFFFSITAKITSNAIFSLDGESVEIPYLIIFFFFWMVLGVIYAKVFFRKLKSDIGWATVFSFISSFILLGFI